MMMDINDNLIQILLDRARKDHEIVRKPEKEDWEFFSDMLTQWINSIIEYHVKEQSEHFYKC